MAISRRSSFQTAAITMQMAKADSADFGFQLKMRMACKKTEIGNGNDERESNRGSLFDRLLIMPQNHAP